MHRRAQSGIPSKDSQTSTTRPKGALVFNIGDIVEVQDKRGTVRFDGNTDFSQGRWIGIELTQPEGKNDGSVQGKRYFECRQNFGMFVRPSQVKIIKTSAPKPNNPVTRRQSSNSRSDLNNAHSNTDRVNRVAEIRARLSKQVASSKKPGSQVETPSSELSTPVPESEGSPVLENEDSLQETEENENLVETQNVDFAPSLSFERSDQTVPFRQYEELRIRLRVLEAKREEDSIKWAKMEKTRTEYEQYRVQRLRVTAKLNSLLEECGELRNQNKELKKEKDLLVEKQSENEIQIESLNIDRELAEEEIFSLQHQISVLRDKLEETALNAEVAQVPNELVEKKVSEGYDTDSAKEILQLQAQIERLKSALKNYREISTQTENQLRSQLRQTEEEATTSKHIKKEYHEVKAALAQAQDDIEIYKERLLDFESSEYMIETLTEQNDSLREKVEKLSKEIEELEAIKEVNDEIEEAYIENNRQMLQEIDHKDVLIRDLQRMIESQQEAMADHSNTVSQYRQLVGSLQDDIKQLQKKTESQLNEAEALQSQSLKMQSLNSVLQSQVIKAHSKTIDLELRKLDAQQASEHLKCIEPYLPESFFKKENDAIRTLLQLKRLVFKSNLMGDYLRDQFPIKSLTSLIGGSSEELMPLSDLSLSNYEFRLLLTELSCIANSFIVYLSSCSVSQFLALSALGHDLLSIERKLDVYLDEIRKEDFIASKHLAGIQGLIGSFVHLRETNVECDTSFNIFSSSQFAVDSVQTAVAGADLINIQMSLIYRALTNPNDVNLFPIIPAQEKSTISQEFLRPLCESLKEYQKIRTVSKKLIESIEDNLAKGLKLEASLQTAIVAFASQHSQLVKFSREASTKLIAFIKEKQSVEEALTFSGLQDIIYYATQTCLDVKESATFAASGKLILDLEKTIKEIFETCSSKENYVSEASKPTPWIERSHEFKKEILINTATERKLVSLNKDISRLVDEVRIRDQTLVERDLKIELTESRMAALKEKLAEAELVREQLKQAQDQERLYLEAVEKLQSENQGLELENIELRQTISAVPTTSESTGNLTSSQLDLQANSMPHTIGGTSSGLGGNGPYDPRLELMAQRVANLADLNFRRRAYQVSLDLQFDPVLPSTRLFSGGSGRLASLKLGEKLHQATFRASALNKDLTAYLATSKVHTPSNPNSTLDSLAHDSLLSTFASQAQTLEATWEEARSQINQFFVPDFLSTAAVI